MICFFSCLLSWCMQCVSKSVFGVFCLVLETLVGFLSNFCSAVNWAVDVGGCYSTNPQWRPHGDSELHRQRWVRSRTRPVWQRQRQKKGSPKKKKKKKSKGWKNWGRDRKTKWEQQGRMKMLICVMGLTVNEWKGKHTGVNARSRC